MLEIIDYSRNGQRPEKTPKYDATSDVDQVDQAKYILQLEDEIAQLKAILKRPARRTPQRDATSLVAALRVSGFDEMLF